MERFSAPRWVQHLERFGWLHTDQVVLVRARFSRNFMSYILTWRLRILNVHCNRWLPLFISVVFDANQMPVKHLQMTRRLSQNAQQFTYDRTRFFTPFAIFECHENDQSVLQIWRKSTFDISTVLNHSHVHICQTDKWFTHSSGFDGNHMCGLRDERLIFLEVSNLKAGFPFFLFDDFYHCTVPSNLALLLTWPEGKTLQHGRYFWHWLLVCLNR